MTRFVPRARALPLLFLALCGAFSSLPALAENVEEGLKSFLEWEKREAKLAALPAECMLGDAWAVPGQWIRAQNSAYRTRPPLVDEYRLEEPIRSGAFHLALNPQALRRVDKAESRDAAGEWNEAWTGPLPDAPDGCEFVKLTQTFTAGEREITALRITIRGESADDTWIGDAGVLKAD